MWTHRATRDNVARLQRDFGYPMVPPETGQPRLGPGGRRAPRGAAADRRRGGRGGRRGAPVRQPDAAARPPLVAPARDPDLAGRHVVVSAGGTAEPIDPVRFIGNRSTGRMGVAIAEAALARGASVTIVAGRVEVPLPEAADRRPRRAHRRDARTRSSTRSSTTAADALVMAAAVADFRPATAATTKLTRGDGMTLELEPTEDILAEVGARARRPRPAAGHRRVRRGDGLARAGAREAAPQGRGPARRERRQRAGLGLRHRHQPGRDPRRGRVARRAAAAHQARGRGPPAGPGRRAVGRTARVARTLAGDPREST